MVRMGGLATFDEVLRAAGKLTLAFLLAAAAWATGAQALTLQPIGSGFEKPIYVTSDPGNPERLFVVEQGGAVLLVQSGEVRLFADISSKVSEGGERGLLSIAMAPDFDLSGRFFLDYTGKEGEPGEIHVAEMTASGDSAALSTLRDVIPPIPHEQKNNHNGGQLQFGPEGALFISTGDGGGANDELHNAQDPASKLGKILRVAPVPGVPSTAQVWSFGLRNPFRFSFDRLTGAIWIGDVGQSAREEVDNAAAPALGQGANYGWNCMEGSLAGPATDPGCTTPPPGGFVPPAFEYPHFAVEGDAICGGAIIGGYVARGPGMGDLYGRYLYGDYCDGDIRSFSPAAPSTTDRLEGLHIPELESFGEDSCGRLYAVSGEGPLYRLVGPERADCPTAPPTTPIYQPAPAPSFVGIRAVSRRVKRHRRGLLTAWVTPCVGRRGDPVTLWRGRRQLGTRHLDRACSVRFRPRIDRRSTFRATVKGDAAHLPAISRKVTVRPVRRHRHR
jgi:glucose/arabinose dehydrogenase